MMSLLGMNMRNRGERRDRVKKKIAKRLRMAKELGTLCKIDTVTNKVYGTLYEKHLRKIQKSGGYMRDGNVSHYVSCKPRKYTKNRNREYGPAVVRKHSERIKYEYQE